MKDDKKTAKDKKIIITGATGQIGRPLSRLLGEKGYQVIVFSRNPEKARNIIPDAAKYVQWNTDSNDWYSEVDGVYGVVNLAGANIFAHRLTRKYAEEIKNSRIASSGSLVAAMAQADKKPEVFVNGSAMSYYGFSDRGNEPVSEDSSPGEDWWSRYSKAVEVEASKAEDLGVRTVNIRTGYVLDFKGSGFPGQVERFRKGQASVVTPESAWNPWIHIEDEVNLFVFALENPAISGPLNATAPEPVTNETFTSTLAEELHVPVKGKTPEFVLRLMLGRAATVIAKGNRIVPEKASENGYQFHYSRLKPAVDDLIARMDAS